MRAALGGAVSCVARRMAYRLNHAWLTPPGIAVACLAAVLLKPDPLWACPGAAHCSQCETAHCNTGDNVWECLPKPSGTACTNGLCDGTGVCIVPPGTPGPISGSSGSSSTSGS